MVSLFQEGEKVRRDGEEGEREQVRRRETHEFSSAVGNMAFPGNSLGR